MFVGPGRPSCPCLAFEPILDPVPGLQIDDRRMKAIVDLPFVAQSSRGRRRRERSGHAIRQGQLFRTWRPRSVRTSDLSGAAGARSRGAFDFRPRWTGALRPGRRVGRCDRLRRQPGEERGFRRRHSPLLARTAKPRLDAGLFRHPAELGGPNDPAADFRIEAQTFGDAMLVNLFGIESPGLTSSLAIAGHVLSLVG